MINATGKMDTSSTSSNSNRKEKPVPHYLKPSAGSCHDRCKYGIKQTFQCKKWNPGHRAHQDHGSKGLDRVDVIKQRCRLRNKDQKTKNFPVKDGSYCKPKFDKRKMSPKKVFNLSDSSSSLLELPAEASVPMVETLPFDAKCSFPWDGESLEGPVSIEVEMPLATHRSETSDEHIINVIPPSENLCTTLESSPTPIDHMKDGVCSERSDGSAKQCIRSTQMNSESVIASKNHEQIEHRIVSSRLSKESIARKAKAALDITRNTASSLRKRKTPDWKVAGMAVEGSNRPKTMRKKADDTGKFNQKKKISSHIASVGEKVKAMNDSSSVHVMHSSAKLARSLKLKASVVKNSFPSFSPGNQTDRKTRLKNVPKSCQVWKKKGEGKLILTPLKLSPSVNTSIKSLLSENTRIVKKEKSASPNKSNFKVQSTHNVAADIMEKTFQTVETKVQKANNNIGNQYHKEKADASRNDGATQSKVLEIPLNNAMQLLTKLSFSRGKVVSLNNSNSENNRVRRVRFSDTQIADENQRSSESMAGRTPTMSGSTAAYDSVTLEDQVVILRHQNEENSNNEQGLFNNVTEEIVSKLVEPRTSKVKALVGAFETVISLQESKAAPEIPAP